MRRRVGGALLAGVTALGVAAFAGGGVASAATPTPIAALTTSATVISGSTASATGGSLSITLSGGTINVGDTITLTVACPATGAIGWASLATSSTGWTVNAATAATGCSEKNIETITAGSSAATTIALTDAFATDGAPSGAVSITGSYAALGVAAANFTVPSPATVSWYTVTSNVPAVTLTSTTTAQAVSNITLGQPANLAGGVLAGETGNTFVVTLTNANFGAVPTMTSVPTTQVNTVTVAATIGTPTATIKFNTTGTLGAPLTATNFVISGLSIVPSGSGPVTAKVALTSGANTGDVTLAAPVASFQGASNRIYGQTPDATVAQEFQAAFPITGNVHPTSVVLATDVDPYDALSAAYLESQLGTGLLITPQASLGADAANAMRLMGITTVYVVGGPLAISPAVIAQLKATPAYNLGGVSPTGSNLSVVGPIYGQTADDTAQAISTYFGGAYGSLPNVSGAYSPTGGAFNDTSGNASATGPVAGSQTAFVIADNDWRDATTLGPIAYAYRIPIILTPMASLGSQASAALTSLGVKQVIVVGGQLALANNVVTAIQALNGGISVLRIAGYDYTETAVQLAKFETAAANTGLEWAPTGYLVSHGDYWSDALGAAAIAGNSNFTFNGTTYGYEPILTTENPTTIGQYLQSYITSLAPSTASVNVLGGPLAVTPTVVSSLQASLAG